ncbi:MAG: thioesterase family protein [Pseudomonadota bacterium]
MLDEATGFAVMDGRVRDEWIDINGHMNVAYYLLAFDLAVDALWTHFGIDDDYVARRQMSTFAVESHVEYLRELRPDAPYTVTTQILAVDGKRLHQFQRMYHRDEGFLAASCEWMNLHVDLSVRRVCPWPDDVLEQILEFARRQPARDWPSSAGSQMRVKSPMYSQHSGGE